MDYLIECIIFLVIVLIVFTKPNGIMDLENDNLGRFMLLGLVILLSQKFNLWTS